MVDGDTRERWRRFQLCKLLSCTPSELDEQNADELDWFAAFEQMVSEIQEERSRQ